MYIYAHINKNTLRFVREQKAISFDYVTRITKFKEDKLALWESNDSGKFPTINQAKFSFLLQERAVTVMGRAQYVNTA